MDYLLYYALIGVLHAVALGIVFQQGICFERNNEHYTFLGVAFIVITVGWPICLLYVGVQGLGRVCHFCLRSLCKK